MGGRANAGADVMAYEASKPRSKMYMEKPVPAAEWLSGQQGSLDIFDDVHALYPEQVAPTPEQVTSLPRHPPPLPQPVVDSDDDGEEVATLAPYTE
uniref:Uncharacterized protein n=1 Tax=Triticum aestivum TaxID=4565 RepID=A0A077S3X9_WHEAT|nr:unnamed protein product [Triticum aestivum]